MRPVVVVLVLWTCGILSGCSQADGAGSVAEVGATVPPGRTIRLSAQSEVPLRIRLLRELKSGEVLIVGVRSASVWLLPSSERGGGREVVRIDRGAHQILGIATTDQELGVLLEDGSVRFYGIPDWTERRAIAANKRYSHRPLGIEVYGGRWWVLTEEGRYLSNGRDRAAWLVLQSLSDRTATVVWEREKWRLSEMGVRATDRSFLAVDSLGPFVGGSFPPRIERVSPDDASSSETGLHHVPDRPLTQRDARAQRAMLDKLPAQLQKSVTAYTSYPALLKVWSIDGGFAVVAAGPGNSMILDLYCGYSYVGSRFAGPSMRDFWPTHDGVAVLRATPDDSDFHIDFFTFAEAGMRCE